MVDDEMVGEIAGMIQLMVSGGASVAGAVRKLATHVPPDLLNAGRVQYEKKVGLIKVLKDPGALVEKEAREGFWYGGPKDDDVFWPALLAELTPKLPAAALQGLDDSSNKIINLMRPPGAVEIRTRGLVLGYVQSGKTTSFMSVAAKAADVGYRMVIVLSGITDNLRCQTQVRLEKQLIGKHDARWLRLTNSTTDFQMNGNAAAYMAADQHRMLAVVKKNPYRLRRLAEWIESAGEARRACPILIIDDEADQASIDVGKTRVSAINSLIRRLLDSPKAAYVAYTATPFANLLIDPAVQDGLYPRDFIVDLPAGEGYYGPERLFGRDLLDHVEDDAAAAPDDVIREVPLDEVPMVQPPKGKGAVHSWAPTVADSLATAIDWFVLATAARWARGDRSAHSSMLVHTSMLAEAHFRLQGVIEDYCDGLTTAVWSGDVATIDRLGQLWEAEHGRVDSQLDEVPVEFSQVQKLLGPVLDDLRVIVDNYRSTERLVYEDGVASTCIAIGGNTLSRGLTLEGLVCSYFVRAASAYDTLLQMGRWFGYRRGYSDLVRIYMTEELEGWFRDLATVEAEIRREISRYESEGLDPSKLAVKIRTHPSMTVTAAAKMRAAVRASIDYSGSREQTILFNHRDQVWLKGNWDAASELLTAGAAAPGVNVEAMPKTSRYVQRAVPASLILDFLATYQFHPDAKRMSSTLMSSYIRQKVGTGELNEWNVIVMSNTTDRVGSARLGPAGEVNLIQRSKVRSSDTDRANIKALAGSEDRGADLADEVLQGLPAKVTDADLLTERDKIQAGPLLALYPIGKDSKVGANAGAKTTNGKPPKVDLQAADDLLGVCIFFPVSGSAGQAVTYLAADLSSFEVEDAEGDIAAMDQVDQQAAEDSASVESGEPAP